MPRISPSSILTIVKSFKSFILAARLTVRLIKDRRVRFRLKLIPLAALAYLLSPFDIIPDFFVPFVGHADDIIICMFMSKLFINLCPQEIVTEHLIFLRDNK